MKDQIVLKSLDDGSAYKRVCSITSRTEAEQRLSKIYGSWLAAFTSGIRMLKCRTTIKKIDSPRNRSIPLLRQYSSNCAFLVSLRVILFKVRN